MLTSVITLLLFIYNHGNFHAIFSLFLRMPAQVLLPLNIDLFNLKIHNHCAHKIFLLVNILQLKIHQLVQNYLSEFFQTFVNLEIILLTAIH